MSKSRAEPRLVRVRPLERRAFEALAIRYFQELNAKFVPSLDWKKSYFPSLVKAGDLSLKWIQVGRRKAGFTLVGVRPHPVLPRRHGIILEFYILPKFRRSGFGSYCARLLLSEFRQQGLEQVQLEIVAGNRVAAAFWTRLGARKSAERYSLSLTSTQ